MKLLIVIVLLALGCADAKHSDNDMVKKEHCVIITFKTGFKDTTFYKSFNDGLKMFANHSGELYNGDVEVIASGVATFKQLY